MAIRMRWSKVDDYLFGIMQSAVTCCVATAISAISEGIDAMSFQRWFYNWIVAWLIMIPVVILAAPWIRALISVLTGRTIR